MSTTHIYLCCIYTISFVVTQKTALRATIVTPKVISHISLVALCNSMWLHCVSYIHSPWWPCVLVNPCDCLPLVSPEQLRECCSRLVHTLSTYPHYFLFFLLQLKCLWVTSVKLHSHHLLISWRTIPKNFATLSFYILTAFYLPYSVVLWCVR